MTDPDSANWAKLGEQVVARRVHLGYRKRPAFSDASGISTRILGDIETGRRGNYDPTTVAALENTLKWATGSVNRILQGGQPTTLDDTRSTPAGERTDTNAALIKVMRSDLDDATKQRIVKILIAEREAFDRRIAEQADEMIRVFGDGY